MNLFEAGDMWQAWSFFLAQFLYYSQEIALGQVIILYDNELIQYLLISQASVIHRYFLYIIPQKKLIIQKSPQQQQQNQQSHNTINPPIPKKMHNTPSQTPTPSPPLPHRRSLRRMNKLLEKNLSEYRIPNPYRSYKSHACLPAFLCRQLSKMDYLSVRALQRLRFRQPGSGELEELLGRMRIAVQRQVEDFEGVVEVLGRQMRRLSEKNTKATIHTDNKSQNNDQADQLNKSAFMPKDSNNSIQLQPPQSESQPYQQEPEPTHALLLPHHNHLEMMMMSDNYQSDKLCLFHLHRNLVGGARGLGIGLGLGDQHEHEHQHEQGGQQGYKQENERGLELYQI